MAPPHDAGAGPGPLPAALQPWHPWLQWFAPELAAQLGTLVQRLHPLLGQFHGRPQDGTPEPDGLDDLRPRGPYERLLATEWLLADEVPDEFLRRAAMGEHLFLAPRPRGQRAERLIVALFDAGPLQLGAPRLAHLALWILLARRALGAGGALRWGVLQAPGELHGAREVQHVLQLLKGRSFVPGDASHWGRWGEVLAGQAAPAAECWLVGAELLPRAASAALPTHQVRVRRSLAGDALEVAVVERRTERALQLPMPPAVAAAALLKGRFDGVAVPGRQHSHAQRLSLQRAPLFSPQGHLVAVPLLDEPGVAVFPLPRAHEPARPPEGRIPEADGRRYPSEPARPPEGRIPEADGRRSRSERTAGAPRRQQWSAGAEPLALCFGGKQIAAVLSDSTHLFFWHLPGLAVQPRPPSKQFHAPPGSATWLPAAWLRHGGAQRLCVIDQSGRLLSWQVAGPVSAGQALGTLSCVDSPVCGLAQYHDGSLVYVQSLDGILDLRQLNASGRPVRRQLLGDGPPDARVWFAGGAAWSRGLGGCAVRLCGEPQEIWRIHQPLEPRGPGTPPSPTCILQLSPGWRAVGLVREPQTGGYALVIQSPNRMTLHRIHPRGEEPLYTAPARMLKCSVCPNTGRVALLTAQRQLIVYDTAERAVRLFVHTSTAEDVHAQA